MTQHCRIRFLRLLSERSGVRVSLAQTSLRNTSKTLRGSQHNSRAVAQLARALTLPFPILICVMPGALVRRLKVGHPEVGTLEDAGSNPAPNASCAGT